MSTSHKHLIVIIGATAVGKTTLSLKLAQTFDAEIVSADSRQFYKELNIGTAKPSQEELALVKHHFINSHSISESYTVGQYEREALLLINSIFKKKEFAILVGGSGLYLKAVCEGMDAMPEVKPELREKLQARLRKEGLEKLLQELKQVDLEYYKKVDKANPQRIVRALEVCLSTGKTYSSFRQSEKKERPFKVIKVGLDRPREELYERINIRIDLMLKEGLLEEAQQLVKFKKLNALQTVGYKEIFGFLDKEYDWAEAVRLLKRNSRRYAKRQLTWFRKEEDVVWFSPEDYDKILRHIKRQVNC